MISLDKIIEEIERKSGSSKEEIKKMIEEKQDELSGLISPEGAAYIVGNELGVSLLKEKKRQLKIENVVSGMRSVDVKGKVMRIFEKRDFERKGKKGSVKNVILGDETGTIRFSLWNNEIEILEGMGIEEGKAIEIVNGFVKEDNRGNYELRLGRVGKIKKLEGAEITVPEREDVKGGTGAVEKRKIHDFKEGQYNQTRAQLIQLFRRNPMFEICPQCEGRLENKDGQWICKEHGKVDPKYRLVLSGIIDDGTGNIRAVFFGEVAERILGRSAEEIRKSFPENILSVYDNIEAVGKEFTMSGRVKFSQFSERPEFVVNEIGEIDVKKEMKDVMKEIDSS